MPSPDVSKSPPTVAGRAAVASPDPDRAVREKAAELGFDAVGFAAADLPLTADFERYEAFLAAGMHGRMGYLASSAEVRRRVDTDAILEGARSVVCVAKSYRRDPRDEALDPPLAHGIARYARGHDYHNFARRRLRQLAKFIRGLGTAEAPARARPLVDDAPVLERAWAARAGLGFIGKNGLLIVPGQGSMVLLGEVVTTLALTPGTPMTERCGECTLCLEACPTGAFVRPFVLEPRRCVSYLTIEQLEEIPLALREGVGEHLFGCDECQTVCPYNGSPRAPAPGRMASFAPLARWSETSLTSLVRLDEEGWQKLRIGTPLNRAHREGIARNAAIVLGNRREKAAGPALRAAASGDPSRVVREAAAWALQRVVERPDSSADRSLVLGGTDDAEVALGSVDRPGGGAHRALRSGAGDPD